MSEINITIIENSIYIIRGQKVILDSDLARLYGVETKMLKRAVKRNLHRFPTDFMFELTSEELKNWRYQFGTSNKEKMGIRIAPFAFTELGVAMLSSILNSENAINVHIAIMRTFVQLRSFLAMEISLTGKVDKLEQDSRKLFKIVFQKLDSIEDQITPKLNPKRKKIGITDS